jgi:RimJ/RimL family protein N-acetyltransferase
VHIEPWSDADVPLLERLLGEPAMMRHLGGPETPEQIAARHARYLAGAERDPQFRVVADGQAVGWVGYWERAWRDEEIYETGWSIVPEFQGRGIAAAATAQALDHARARGSRRHVHAFPSVENAPSNAICRKLGFTLLGAYDFEYPAGNPLRCNDWRLDLTRSA